MKKSILFLLCLSLLALCSCGKKPTNEEIEENIPEIQKNTEAKTMLPVNFELGNVEVVLNEIIETKTVEFNDNAAKIKLTNSDGKYYQINYILKNNEMFKIDIDHSLEVSVVCGNNEVYYGEYYEDKTGEDNIEISSGESKNVSFVCDTEAGVKIRKIIFKYSDKTYEYELEKGDV